LKTEDHSKLSSAGSVAYYALWSHQRGADSDEAVCVHISEQVLYTTQADIAEYVDSIGLIPTGSPALNKRVTEKRECNPPALEFDLSQKAAELSLPSDACHSRQPYLSHIMNGTLQLVAAGFNAPPPSDLFPS